jgi:hypothetical protein
VGPEATRFVPPEVPISNSPPLVAGQVWTSAALGYSFEYDPDNFDLSSPDDKTAILDLNFADGEIVVHGAQGSVSVSQMIEDELATVDTFMIGRTLDNADIDAVLGGSIGYLRGEARVYSGTLLGSNGTPVAPGGITIVAATDGRITAAVIVIVGNPDSLLGDKAQQYVVRQAADQILKTFNWGNG